MKYFKILFFGLILCNIHMAVAQNYIPVDNGSTVAFTIKNFGFSVDGSFKNLQGNIVFDANHLSTSSLNVTVSSATIDTKNKARDNHLKEEEYFDVTKYPTITFVSEKIEKEAPENTYKVTGKFTIKNKTKQVVFNFLAVPSSNGFQFSGKIDLKRRDYGIGGGSMILSDNLVLALNVLAQRK